VSFKRLKKIKKEFVSDAENGSVQSADETSVCRKEATKEDWRIFNIGAHNLYSTTNINSVKLFGRYMRRT